MYETIYNILSLTDVKYEDHSEVFQYFAAQTATLGSLSLIYRFNLNVFDGSGDLLAN